MQRLVVQIKAIEKVELLERDGQGRFAQVPRHTVGMSSAASVLLSSLELSDTNVYGP